MLSHLGSGGVIMQARLDAGLRGEALADDFAPRVWNEWNAKTLDTKVADALAVDRALVDRLASFTDDERARVGMSVGPLQFDFAGVVGLRLNNTCCTRGTTRSRCIRPRHSKPRPCRSSSTTSA